MSKKNINERKCKSAEVKSALLHFYTPILLLVFFLLTACGTDNRHCRIEGRFRHLNQGEFFVYSPDGIIDRMDTIRVQDSRFAYNVACEHEGTFILVFPNFSEQPVFVKPGKTVTIKADASRLKEMEVTGTKENKLMNKFREAIVDMSPPETKNFAELFIRDHAETLVSNYLLNRYFLQTPEPDYQKAASLLTAMQKSQPINSRLARLQSKIKSLQNNIVGQKLPAFSGTDTNGQKVSNVTFSNAPVAVIYMWASWNYDSMNMQRELKKIQRQADTQLKLLAICLDPSTIEFKRINRADSISWPTVCDGQMFESPIIQKLGLSTVPDNIILQNGRIVAHGLNTEDLKKKLQELTK